MEEEIFLCPLSSPTLFFLAHIRYGYIGVANDSIFKSTMSSKLINAAATLYNHLVTKWVTNKVLNSYKDDICPFSPKWVSRFPYMLLMRNLMKLFLSLRLLKNKKTVMMRKSVKKMI